jgi:hypothetical protein
MRFLWCDNPDFTDFICSFGLQKQEALSAIFPCRAKTETAAVNISAGYYNEHRLNEYIDLEAVRDNITGSHKWR